MAPAVGARAPWLALAIVQWTSSSGLLGLGRADAASVVDTLVHAAAVESCHRVNEAVIDNFRVGAAKMGEAIDGLLFRASRELGGNG